MSKSKHLLVLFGLTLLVVASVNCGRSIGRGKGKPSYSKCRRCIEELQPMNIRADQITLSGFSSGGTMAQIMQFAYSSVIQGIAVFSHTFLRCGPPNGVFQDWDKVCTNLDNATESQYYDTDLVHKDIQNYYEKGYIEDPRNIRNKRLYVYTGLRSQFFAPVQALNILKVYERYIQNQYRIKTRVQDSTLVMPTDNDYGKACTEDTSDTWFIGKCGFSGAFDALRFLYADDFRVIHPKNYQGPLEVQPLRLFNQKPFLKGIKNHQMDDVGFMYIPTGCQYGTPCPLHVFFHGCWNSRNVSGTAFIENSGFMEVAEANGIVMLFPQNNPEQLYNTDARACWDTFGVGGPLYATQKGPQVRAVRRIISAMVGNRPRNNNYYD